MNAVTDTPTTEMPMPFVFTDAAADKVKQLIDEEGNPDLKPYTSRNVDMALEH